MSATSHAGAVSFIRPKYTVFVSSTKNDLSEQRERVAATILKAQHVPCGMEQFASGNDRGWGVITDTIDLCDYYVLIIAGRYGSIDRSGLSWTEREYNYAVEKGLPVIAFIRSDANIAKRDTDLEPEKQEKLRAFIQRVKDTHAYTVWREADDLCTEVLHGLNQQIDRDHRERKIRPGWYRGNALPPRTDGWERCGNVYWMAYDILSTVFMLVTGQENSNLGGAAHHAEQLPLPPIHAARIRQVESSLGDPQRRTEAIGTLMALSQELGRTIQDKQPDFDERDPWRQGKRVFNPIT